MLPGEWRRNTNNHLANIVQQSGNRNAANARWVRDKLKEYVNGVGKVPWQEDIVWEKEVNRKIVSLYSSAIILKVMFRLTQKIFCYYRIIKCLLEMGLS